MHIPYTSVINGTLKIICLILLSCCGSSSPSDKDLLHKTNPHFLDWYQAHIKPLFQQQPIQYLEREKHVRIAFRHFSTPNADQLFMIFPGYTEPAAKYAELVQNILNAGHDVLVIDHRGQGDSSKILTTRDAGYVDKFDDYIHDAKALFEKVKSTHTYRRHVAIGASMGGAIVTQLSLTHPHTFDSLVLIAPMFQIKTGKYTQQEALQIAQWNIQLGRSKAYVIGKGPWNEQPTGFRGTSDFTRGYLGWLWSQENPHFRVGGPSYQWLVEAIHASRNIRLQAHALNEPTLILGSAEDHMVEPRAFEDFCLQAPRCQLQTISGSHHEILQERDEVRTQAIQAILDA
ncbi:MAG: alpha/beta fold hydrolase [Zetaproteobacteria bacterium]|nr:alpha/beta fold hydrolase [Zetaproteobacteria bacterium]